MAKDGESKEKRCRNNIATILSLMGFQEDDHPNPTFQLMLQKLYDSKRKQCVVTEVKTPSRIRKITFKSHGKSYVNNHSQIFEVGECSSTIHHHHNANDSMEFYLSSFISNIGGSNPILVIEKRLTVTDVTSNQGRLLIPSLKVKNSDFLTIEEKKNLGRKQDLSVRVYDPELRKWILNLAQWKMKHENYVLKTGWNDLVSTNGLKEDMVIRVFSFRVEHQLCFAIVHVN